MKLSDMGIQRYSNLSTDQKKQAREKFGGELLAYKYDGYWYLVVNKQVKSRMFGDKKAAREWFKNDS